MSENNNDAHLGDEVEVPEEITLKEGDEGYDQIDWKANAEKNKGIAQRNKTRAEKARQALAEKGEKKDGEPGKKDDSKGLDRVDKAVLRAEKITDPKEVELVEAIMKETGKDVEGVLASKYFQGELKTLREEAAADNATPHGTNRSGNASRDSVDYWIAKGELPPMEQSELRTKVVNAKIAKEKSQSQFSSTPIS